MTKVAKQNKVLDVDIGPIVRTFLILVSFPGFIILFFSFVTLTANFNLYVVISLILVSTTRQCLA